MTGGLAQTVRPELDESQPGHWVRCHLPQETRQRIAGEILTTLHEKTA